VIAIELPGYPSEPRPALLAAASIEEDLARLAVWWMAVLGLAWRLRIEAVPRADMPAGRFVHAAFVDFSCQAAALRVLRPEDLGGGAPNWAAGFEAALLVEILGLAFQPLDCAGAEGERYCVLVFQRGLHSLARALIRLAEAGACEEILRRMLDSANAGEPVTLAGDAAGFTATVRLPGRHTHAGVPDGDWQTFVRQLRAAFSGGAGLSWASEAADLHPIPGPCGCGGPR